MSLLRCLIGLHSWRALKYGGSQKVSLDARDCRRCGRFEVWAYANFYRANREMFEPLVLAGEGRP